MTEPLVPTDPIAASQKTLSQNNVVNGQSLLDASPHEDALRWSRHVLRGNESQQSSDCQLSDSKSPDSAELLRLLAKRDYFLSRDETDAFLTLGQPTSPSLTMRIRERMSHRGKTLRLTDAVNAFAREFFNVPSDERADQWNRLHERCLNEPGLLRRLDELKPALQAEKPSPTGDEHYDRLVEVAAKVFSLPPDEGARLRQQFLVDALEKPKDWIDASRKLHSRLSYFSKHVAEWTCPLMESREQNKKQTYEQKRREQNRSTPAEPEPEPTPLQTPTPVSTEQNWPLFFFVIFVAVIVFRFLSAYIYESNNKQKTSDRGPTTSIHLVRAVRIPDSVPEWVLATLQNFDR